MRQPGPAKARTLRSHEESAATGMLRWASGNDGVVSARRHPLTGTSLASGDLTASDLDTRSPTRLTMVNFTYKLDLTLAAVNRTLPASAVLFCKRSNRGLSSRFGGLG